MVLITITNELYTEQVLQQWIQHMRVSKKNWLEPADGLKKKKKISDRQRGESHSAKHHVWTNPTFTKTTG